MIALIIDNESWVREYRGSIKHEIRSIAAESTLDTLERLVESEDVCIVLPVIVIEEWRRHRDDPKRNLSTTINEAVGIARSLRKFLSDDAGSMLEFLVSPERFNEERILEVVERRAQMIEELFEHRFTARVEVSNESMHRAVKAALAKKAPFHQGNSMADALILFSALEHVQSENYEATYFVSNNTSDFSSKDDPDLVHPDLAPLFDETGVKYFRLLAHALGEVPNSKIQEETIAEAEREEERERLLEQVSLRALEPYYRIGELFRFSQPNSPLQAVIDAMNEQQREAMRTISDALQPNTAFLDFINLMSAQQSERMREITEALWPKYSRFPETFSTPKLQVEGGHEEEE